MKHFYFLMLLFNILYAFAQKEYKKSIDSLNVLLNNTTNDAIKINYYENLCKIFSEYDLKEFKKCNEVLLTKAKKIHSLKGFGFYYCNRGKLSLHTNLKEAIVYSKKGRHYFYILKDWDNYIYANTILVNILNNDGQFTVSIDLLNKTTLIALKRKNQYLYELYYLLSKTYRLKDDNVNAIYYAKKALICKVPSKKKYLIYHSIVTIYAYMKNYNKALEYSLLDEKYSVSPESKFSASYRRAQILMKINRNKEALSLLMSCLQYYTKQKSTLDVLDTYRMISICYFNLHNFKKANLYIDILIKNITSPEPDGVFDFSRKALISLELQDIKKAKIFSNKALNLINNNTDFNDKMQAYEAKVKLEKILENYKTALYYNQKILDSTKAKYSENNKNKLNQLEVELDVFEKNYKIKNLQITQLKKQSEITTKNNYIMYISLALCIAMLSIVFYISGYKTIRKKNNIIEAEKLLVKKSLIEKETLLKEIHHRVKNNMQLVISLLKIQASDTNLQNIENFIEISENRIRSMALIHEFLYESDNINYINFENYLKRLCASISASFSGLSHIKIETCVEQTNFDIETSIPLGLIINELVLNAYKHAFIGKNKGIIKIELLKGKDFYELIIQDDGIGIDDAKKISTSIGLKIVRLLVSQIDGTLTIENNAGTTFKITFPVLKRK